MKNSAKHGLVLALSALTLCIFALVEPASAHAEKAEKFPYGKKGKTEKSFTSCYYSKKISKLNMTVEVPEFEGCDPLNKSIKKWLITLEKNMSTFPNYMKKRNVFQIWFNP